ncbi:MAG: hypothetical protein ACFFBD_25040 [Candidatus Hodarchaeota archaeon]
MEENKLIRLLIGIIILIAGITTATFGGHPVTSGFFTQMGQIGVFLNALMYIGGLIAAFIGLFIVYQTLKAPDETQKDTSTL